VVSGPLSHSSIVAREYGIPAVLGTGVAYQVDQRRAGHLRAGRRRSGGSRRLVEIPEERMTGVAFRARVAGPLFASRPTC
jgi:phosphoenolpyruvate synthase/pyruvate phosphate dikinase